MPRLKVTHPNSERTEYAFGEQEVTVGRETDNLVVIDDSKVSRHHAVIEFIEEAWWLRDLGSANGTFSKGAKVDRMRLSDRTSFEIGGHKFRFSLGAGKSDKAERAKTKMGAETVVSQGRGKGKKKGKKRSVTDSSAPPPLDQSAAKPKTVSVAADVAQVVAKDERYAVPEPNRAAVSLAELVAPVASTFAGGRPLKSSLSKGASESMVAKDSTTERRSRSYQGALVAIAALLAAGIWWKSGGPTSPPIVGSGPSQALVAEHSDKNPADSLDLEEKKSRGSDTARVEQQRGAPATSPPAKLSMRMSEPDPIMTARPADVPVSKLEREPHPSVKIPDVELGKVETERTILFTPQPQGAGFQPVISPRLNQVLHLERSADGGQWLDLFLNNKAARKNVKVRGEGDLHFSPDGAGWAVPAVDDKGRSVILMHDRVIPFEGELLQFAGNSDFSVIATVTRKDGEDHLSINGATRSSYHHIRGLQLSEDGREWAYVAVRLPGSQFSREPAGERVVSSEGPLEIVDEVRDLRLSSNGSSLAWIAVDRTGMQKLVRGSELVYQLAASEKSEIQSVTLSGDGDHLAWAVVPEKGPTVFYFDGTAQLRAFAGSGGGDGSIKSHLQNRERPLTRILFSNNGQRTLFAAAGERSMIHWRGGSYVEHACIQLDSITLSDDGQRVAYVTLEADEANGAESMQLHRASLWVENKKVMVQEGVWVKKMENVSNLIFGGISGVRFSPKGNNVACIASRVTGSLGHIRTALFVDGVLLDTPHQHTIDTCWQDEHRLVVLGHAPDTDAIESITIKVNPSGDQ